MASPEAHDLQVFISVSIVMLVATLVTERIANFIKLYFNGKTLFIPCVHKRLQPNGCYKSAWLLKAKIVILNQKQPTKAGEKEREYRIQLISILIGTLFAALFNFSIIEVFIDFFKNPTTTEGMNIFKGYSLYESDNTLDWKLIYKFFNFIVIFWGLSLILFRRLDELDYKVKNETIYKQLIILLILVNVPILFCKNLELTDFIRAINKVFGFFITGVFLSLGSKFWHDLLGVLFYIKNAKRTLSQGSTFTEYDDPSKIMALSDISHYEVCDKLYKSIEDELDKIEGVLTHGVDLEYSDRLNMHIRQIVVEFTSEDAHEKLIEMARKESISINHNTFYLKDYFSLVFCEGIKAVNSNIKSMDNAPVCYAYNVHSEFNPGSFHVFKKDNQYYAESNMHVFATPDELQELHVNPNYQIQQTEVAFQIGNQEYRNNYEIDKDQSYFDNDAPNPDYAICEVDEALYQAYQKEIKFNTNILDEMTPDGSMIAFGANSKVIRFKPFIDYSKRDDFSIDYNDFVKLFTLHQIRGRKRNALKGDSGGVIHYITSNHPNEVQKAMIVGSSVKCTFIFKL